MRKMSKEFEEKVLSILEEHSQMLKEQGQTLREHSKILEEHSQMLKEQGQMLKEQSQMLREHSQKLEEHSKILQEHTKDIKDIKNYLFVFENKISNELPALFDGYSMNIEKTSEIEFKQKATDKKVEFNSIRISNLEKVSKQHDKQLKKLTSH